MTLAPQVLMGGRYRATERVAVGGMGEIWQGEDAVLQRRVAIKVLRADFANDLDFRGRFRDEARHAALLTQANVTQVFDFVDDDGDLPPCIVMEYVDGESLASILDREGRLDVEQTWSILGQTAAALGAAHRVGLVHRDVKPGNILVCPNGLVKVTDFGIARLVGEAATTHPGLVLGTASFLAPEQLAGEKATPASDMYSLGVVGYACLAGAPPFQGETRDILLAHQNDDPPPLPAGVPRGLADLVFALLAKNPADRPTDPDAIAKQARRLTSSHALDRAFETHVPNDEPYPTERVHPPRGATSVMLPAASRRTGWRELWKLPRAHPTALAAGLLVAVIVAIALLSTRILTTGPANRSARPGATGSSSSATKSLALSAPTLFGGSDHPEELSNVTDSSPSTAWYTEHYASADFGGLKSGVGLRLQLPSAAAVRTVVIRFADAGVAAKLFAGDASSLSTSSQPVAATSSAPSEWRVSLTAPVKASSWLLWITRLVPDSGGYRAGVADVQFFA